MLTDQKKRFQIQKLEERIAPSGCGGHRGHDKYDCSCGDREVNILSGNDVDILSNNKESFQLNLFSRNGGGGKHW